MEPDRVIQYVILYHSVFFQQDNKTNPHTPIYSRPSPTPRRKKYAVIMFSLLVYSIQLNCWHVECISSLVFGCHYYHP